MGSLRSLTGLELLRRNRATRSRYLRFSPLIKANSRSKGYFYESNMDFSAAKIQNQPTQRLLGPNISRAIDAAPRERLGTIATSI
jgi:hypothetical protein